MVLICQSFRVETSQVKTIGLQTGMQHLPCKWLKPLKVKTLTYSYYTVRSQGFNKYVFVVHKALVFLTSVLDQWHFCSKLSLFTPKGNNIDIKCVTQHQMYGCICCSLAVIPTYLAKTMPPLSINPLKLSRSLRQRGFLLGPSHSSGPTAACLVLSLCVSISDSPASRLPFFSPATQK